MTLNLFLFNFILCLPKQVVGEDAGSEAIVYFCVNQKNIIYIYYLWLMSSSLDKACIKKAYKYT